MEYSNSKRTLLQEKYHEAFGPLQEGVHRLAANTGQISRMYLGMEESLKAGEKLNLEDYVNLSGDLSRPTPAELRLISET